MVETIGKRIAFLRQKNGWTQQSLADRLAMSRVAISHIEMDLTIPSERSVTLMAGVFKLAPIALVEGTTYPRAKAERLPGLTTIYTELELHFALLKNDLDWITRLENLEVRRKCISEVQGKWFPLLEIIDLSAMDEREMNLLLEMRRLVKELNSGGHHLG